MATIKRNLHGLLLLALLAGSAIGVLGQDKQQKPPRPVSSLALSNGNKVKDWAKNAVLFRASVACMLQGRHVRLVSSAMGGCRLLQQCNRVSHLFKAAQHG
jgi:hypothetical protein